LGRRWPAARLVAAAVCLPLAFLACSDSAPSGDSDRGPAPSAAADLAIPADPDRPPGAPPEGKWRAARRAGPDETTRALVATPYLQGYRAAGTDSGVTVHVSGRAAPGLNLYVSGHAPEAVLMDMDGRVLHRWRRELSRLWPDAYETLGTDLARRLEYWRRAALLPDGGLIAIYEGIGAVRLDRSSRPVWAYRGGAHHDLFVPPDGTTWLLDRRPARLAEIPGRSVLEDLVTVLGPDGRPRRQVSVLAALARSPYAGWLRELPSGADVLHTNTLEMLDERALGMGVPGVRPGQLLLSLHTLDAVAVLDMDRGEIVWATRGEWRRQHQPTLLAGGRLLLFDNGGERGASQVLELAPATGQVAWRWPPRPDPGALYSRTLGSVQRLPGGNTLITESENGRALEVTPGGDVVWEFHSPHRAGARGELVATLFEVIRVAPQPWVAAPAEADGSSD
jgi:hypothetical protein